MEVAKRYDSLQKRDPSAASSLDLSLRSRHIEKNKQSRGLARTDLITTVLNTKRARKHSVEKKQKLNSYNEIQFGERMMELNRPDELIPTLWLRARAGQLKGYSPEVDEDTSEPIVVCAAPKTLAVRDTVEVSKASSSANVGQRTPMPELSNADLDEVDAQGFLDLLVDPAPDSLEAQSGLQDQGLATDGCDDEDEEGEEEEDPDAADEEVNPDTLEPERPAPSRARQPLLRPAAPVGLPARSVVPSPSRTPSRCGSAPAGSRVLPATFGQSPPSAVAPVRRARSASGSQCFVHTAAPGGLKMGRKQEPIEAEEEETLEQLEAAFMSFPNRVIDVCDFCEAKRLMTACLTATQSQFKVGAAGCLVFYEFQKSKSKFQNC